MATAKKSRSAQPIAKTGTYVHDNIELETITYPPTLPSSSNFYVAVTASGAKYAGQYYGLDMNDCFFAYRLKLSVNPSSFKDSYDVAALLEATPLPLTYDLLCKIYWFWLRKSNPDLHPSDANSRMAEVVGWFHQMGWITALIAEGTVDALLTTLPPLPADVNSLDQLARPNNLVHRVINRSILGLHEQMAEMIGEVGYFHGNRLHLALLEILRPGYMRYLSAETIRRVEGLVRTNPYLLFFDSTVPLGVETPKLPIAHLALPDKQRARVAVYGTFKKVLTDRQYHGSTCLPSHLIHLNEEIKAELIHEKALVEESWPTETGERQVFLFDGFDHTAEVGIVKYLGVLLDREAPDYAQGPPATLVADTDPDQTRAVAAAFTCPVVVNTGLGGRGKTYAMIKQALGLATHKDYVVVILSESGAVNDRTKIQVERGQFAGLDTDVRAEAYLQPRNFAAEDDKLDSLQGKRGRVYVRTLAKFLQDLKGRDRVKNVDVVVIEEASMLSARNFFQVLRLVHGRILTLILNGDFGQLVPVAGGRIYPLFERLRHPRMRITTMTYSHRVLPELAAEFDANLAAIRAGSTVLPKIGMSLESNWAHIHVVKNTIGRVVEIVKWLMERYAWTKREHIYSELIVATKYNADIDLANAALFKLYYPTRVLQPGRYYVGERLIFMSRKLVDDEEEQCAVYRRSLRTIAKIELIEGYFVPGARQNAKNFKPMNSREDYKTMREIGARPIYLDVPFTTQARWSFYKLTFEGRDTLSLFNFGMEDLMRGYALGPYSVQGQSVRCCIQFGTENGLYRALAETVDMTYTLASRSIERYIFVGNLAQLTAQIKRGRDHKAYSCFEQRFIQNVL